MQLRRVTRTSVGRRRWGGHHDRECVEITGVDTPIVVPFDGRPAVAAFVNGMRRLWPSALVGFDDGEGNPTTDFGHCRRRRRSRWSPMHLRPKTSSARRSWHSCVKPWVIGERWAGRVDDA